jgi:hypothetical protein
MSAKVCENGDECKFMKLGTCKFAHKANPKAQPLTTLAKHAGENVGVKLAPRVKATPQIRPLLARIAELKKATMLVKDGYVDTKATPSLSDEKFLSAEMEMLRTAARGILGHGKAKTVLYTAQQSISAGVGASIASTVGLSVTASGEWSSFAALYDECIVTHMDVHYSLIATTFANAALCEYAVGYDSTRSSNPTSQADVMESSQHSIGAFSLGGSIPGAVTATTSNGYRRFSISQNREPVANATTVTGGSGVIPNFPGEWWDTANAASLAYTTGYISVYASPSAGNGLSFRYNVAFRVSFRERT